MNFFLAAVLLVTISLDSAAAATALSETPFVFQLGDTCENIVAANQAGDFNFSGDCCSLSDISTNGTPDCQLFISSGSCTFGPPELALQCSPPGCDTLTNPPPGQECACVPGESSSLYESISTEACPGSIYWTTADASIALPGTIEDTTADAPIALPGTIDDPVTSVPPSLRTKASKSGGKGKLDSRVSKKKMMM
jgi:hypothetical protein